VPLDTPSDAARYHLERGRQPVPVEKNSKRPSGGDAWQLRRYSTSDDLKIYFPSDGNIGLRLGPDSGNLVDIDLDCPEAILLARAFLPETKMIHGRPSSPLSHYWYVVDRPIDSRQFRAPKSAPGGSKMLVEFRSSAGEKGFQTVVPPSVHKDTGERLEWLVDDGEPTVVSTEDLLASVRVVAAGALLARCFPKEGSRHEFALALAGALLRYVTDEDAAYQFIYEVCRVGGSTDPAARAQVVRSTARKLEQGSGDVTGIPRLMQIVGDDVGKKVCEWLDLRDTSADALRDAAQRMMLGAPATSGSPSSSATASATASAPQDALGGFLASFSGGGAITIPDPVQSASGAAPAASPAAFPALGLLGLPADTDPDDEASQAAVTMKRDKNGKTLPCGHNAYIMLKYAAATAGCFRWDDVDKKLVVTGKFGTVEPNMLDVVVTDWLMSEIEVNVDKSVVADRIARIAFENRFDPIKEYLRGIKWDGTPRLDTWLERYAGADPTDTPDGYLSFVGRKWLVSSVARALDPGCKADLVLILEGEQGTGKSSLFEMLGGKWYVDLTISLHDKDAKMLNAGAWISELPDLAALKKTSEINAVKAFFSTRVDKFRPPYGKNVITSPRRTVYGASTNDLTYLSDVTGNRRFCCVKTGAIDRIALLRDRDQLFAEAVALYDKHLEECESKMECCCWWPTKEEALDVEREASRRIEDPATTEIISAWWCALPQDQRPQRVLTSRIAKEVLKCDEDRISKATQMDITGALKRLGFTRKHGRVEGYAQPCWYWVPSDALNALPQSDGIFSTRRMMSVVKPPSASEPN
jgi:hypothetical protein